MLLEFREKALKYWEEHDSELPSLEKISLDYIFTYDSIPDIKAGRINKFFFSNKFYKKASTSDFIFMSTVVEVKKKKDWTETSVLILYVYSC